MIFIRIMKSTNYIFQKPLSEKQRKKKNITNNKASSVYLFQINMLFRLWTNKETADYLQF